MTAFRGTPPHHGAGEMAARTQALRPALGLTAEEVAQVRHLRKQGLHPAQIATSTGLALDLIERACLAMRMPHPNRGRGTLNVTVEAHRLVHRERLPGEAVWETFDRLMDELLRRRKMRR